MKKMTCPNCKGTGFDVMTDDQVCGACGGEGEMLIKAESPDLKMLQEWIHVFSDYLEFQGPTCDCPSPEECDCESGLIAKRADAALSKMMEIARELSTDH